MARHALAWIAWTAGLWLLWLLLISKRPGAELLVGLATAVLAAGGATAMRAVGLPIPRPRARALARAWLLPWEIVRDLALVLAAVPRRPGGAFREVPLPARDEGSRAVAALLATLPPNTIVVHVDARRGRALVHELVP